VKNLAVVTSCSGYGKYLPDWATSIASQTSKPAEVAIVVHGNAHDSEHLPRTRRILEEAGISVAVDVVADRLDFGAARNRAVRMTSAPWCMHLDADDVLLPHALADAAAIAEGADVIGFGYERFGDLAAGPANRTRLYGDYDGDAALKAAAPCSGVSPFRREFFDRRPYRLGMLGAWDTALWIGFAKMGARFRATRRPVFGYRQHADSIFNRRRLTYDFTHYAVVHELHGLRHDWAGVTVAIPFKPDGGARDRALEFVRAWYARHFPEWEVKVGQDTTGGAWSKHAATVDALRTSHGRIVVVADADCLCDPRALAAAVEAVELGAPWAIPHREVHRLTEAETAAWYADGVDRPIIPPAETRSLMRAPYVGYAGGGFVVARRDRWAACGGFPAVFTGWGCEDEAVADVLTTLLGEPERFAADLVHLWHPKGFRTQSAEYHRNREKLRAFRAARGNPEAMFALVNPRRRGRPCENCPPPARGSLYANVQSGPLSSKTRAATLEIRRKQAERNEEARRLNDAALAAARARRIGNRSNGAEPQR
jgi:hypothetical protein